MSWEINIHALQRLKFWSCPGEAELAGFVDHGLPPRHQRRIERHLAACGECCDRIGTLVKSQRFNAEAELDPTLLNRAILLADTTQAASRSPGFAWFTASAAVASAVVAIAIGVSLRYPATPPAIATSPRGPSSTRPLASVVPKEAPLSNPREPDLVRNRNVRAHVLVLSPRAGSQVNGTPLIQWRPIRQALTYDVRLLSASGDVLWRNQVQEDHIAIPASVHLTPGEKYFVLVRAYLPDGKTIDSTAIDFRLAPTS